jgi:hypothetical protein
MTAVSAHPGQMGFTGHAMPHSLDQPDRCDVVDGLNDELVLALSESRRGDMETHHDVSARISDSFHRAPEKVESVSTDSGSLLAVFSRVVQNQLLAFNTSAAPYFGYTVSMRSTDKA